MSRPGIPRKLHIGPISYDVTSDPVAIEAMEEMLGAALMGFCLPSKQVIACAEGLSYDTATSVLLHESLHAMLDQSALVISHKMAESLVSSLAFQLMAYMRDNPAMVKRLSSSPPLD